jgi:serine/threonine protein kinase
MLESSGRLMPTDPRLASRYELKGRLGEGGMGIVYRAFDATTRSEVAIKTMRDVSDPAAVELFTKEWSVLAGMSHPNIVDVRDVGEFEQNGCRTPFFVMPLLGGTTLATLIRTKSPRLTPALIIEVMLQVCRGLQAAHELGLIHRDLKPSNIFVLNDDTAKIIDFGVVHFAGTHSISGHKGTWQYMAPEVSELKPATVASDIFSLGVICYEALTGRCPFLRRTAAETVEAIRTYTAPRASDLNSLVPSALSAVVQKALAKSAAVRFPSARDLATALRRALPEEVEAQADSTPTQLRMSRAQKAMASSRYDFSLEILLELEAENPGDPAVAALRREAEEGLRQSRIRQLLEASRTRLEHDEILLALAKLREVRQFAPDDIEAATLAGEIKRRHQELIEIRLRPRKEAIYESAMQVFRAGGVAEAIQRLESLLLMAGPVDPEWRDALQAARNNERGQPADGFTPQDAGRTAFYEPSTAPRAARTADHTSFFPSDFLGDSVVSSPPTPPPVEGARPTRMAWIVAAAVAPVVVLIGVASLHTPAPPPVPPAPVTDVGIATVPADADVAIDGQLQRNRHISLIPGRTYNVTVSKRGYLPIRRDELPHAHWNFTLAPEPLRVRILTAAKEDGTVFLDGRIIGVLTKGVFSGFELPADGATHKIGARTINGDLFSAAFMAIPGAHARVPPGQTADLISIATLGSEATVYGGARERSIAQGTSTPREIPDGGLDLLDVSAQKNGSMLRAPNGEVFPIDAGNGPRLDFWLPERRNF